MLNIHNTTYVTEKTAYANYLNNQYTTLPLLPPIADRLSLLLSLIIKLSKPLAESLQQARHDNQCCYTVFKLITSEMALVHHTSSGKIATPFMPMRIYDIYIYCVCNLCSNVCTVCALTCMCAVQRQQKSHVPRSVLLLLPSSSGFFLDHRDTSTAILIILNKLL